MSASHMNMLIHDTAAAWETLPGIVIADGVVAVQMAYAGLLKEEMTFYAWTDRYTSCLRTSAIPAGLDLPFHGPLHLTDSPAFLAVELLRWQVGLITGSYPSEGPVVVYHSPLLSQS